MNAVRGAKREWNENKAEGVQLNEWAKEGWTYHAKGK